MVCKSLQQAKGRAREVTTKRRAVNGPAHKSPLVEQVNRQKARWLKRVMYELTANSTAKCFAYAVADHLNCVTMDCWPGQLRFAKLLGRRSVKTAQRAARELEELGLLTIEREGRNRLRYAPVFTAAEEDKFAYEAAEDCLAEEDKNGQESFLPNPSIESASRDSTFEYTKTAEPKAPAYGRRQRGAIEIALARMLGRDGINILGRLASHNDGIVDRLCRAYAEGRLGDAARLAAEQM